MPSPLPPTIAALISLFKSRSFQDLPALFGPDATYWVQGRPPIVPYGGSLPALERFPALIPILGLFETYDFQVLEAVVDERDGKRVALRIGSSGKGGKAPDMGGEEGSGVPKSEGDDGIAGKERVYENFVAMVFRLGEDGKVASMREYLDNFCPAALFRGEQVFVDEIGDAGDVISGVEDCKPVSTGRAVRGYVEDLGKGDLESAKKWLHTRGRYWVNGRKRDIKDAGWMEMEERMKAIEKRLGTLRDVKIELHGMIVDGSSAVTETTTSGYSKASGMKIEDTAATFWNVKDGRIAQVYEYGDHVSGRL